VNVTEEMVGHKLGEFLADADLYVPRGRQEGFEGLTDEQASHSPPRGGQRGESRVADRPHQPAQARPVAATIRGKKASLASTSSPSPRSASPST